ncbi:MAG TPA: PPC domain-containing protein [Gemmatimonadales bacterium]|nr:PPC domain-containing protein [Gemmatimonadales bacterium]
MHFCFRRRAGFLTLLIAAGVGACGDGGTGPGDGDGDGNGTPLTSDTPLTGRSGDEGSTELYRITVPAGATRLTVTTTGGTGDLDLYVRQGQEPTPTSHDCESAGGDNDELCEFDDPAAGTWYIMLEAFETYSGASLLATVTIGGSGDVTAVCGGLQGGNLNGDWRRAGDFGAPNAAGMLVRHENGEGTIMDNPGTGFAIGEVKWHSFQPSDCTIQSLFTNESGTTQEYQSISVSLNAAETQLTMGQAIYNRE